MSKFLDIIKKEYREDKFATIFSGAVLLFAILNFLKPSSTEGILEYLGMSALNLIILSAVVVLIWVVFIRKNKGRRR